MGPRRVAAGGIMPSFAPDHQRMIEAKCGNAQKILGTENNGHRKYLDQEYRNLAWALSASR